MPWREDAESVSASSCGDRCVRVTCVFFNPLSHADDEFEVQSWIDPADEASRKSGVQRTRLILSPAERKQVSFVFDDVDMGEARCQYVKKID